MAKGMSKRTSIAVSSAVLAIILCLTIVLNTVLVYWDQPLTLFLGTVGETAHENGSGENAAADFLSAYSTDAELIAAQAEFTERLTSEAVVMLKNEGVLPLAEGSAVSLFGITAASGVASGSGSGDVKSDEVHTWAGSIEAAGFQVNRTLLDLYANGGYAHGAGTASGGGNERGDWSINEMPQSAYTADVKNSYSSYHDAAIVFFSRSSGEGGDLAREMSRFGGSADRHYLELSPEEEDLLAAVQEAGFEKTIVVVNSANAMELGFLDEERFGIDACIWMAGSGANGVDVFGKLLKGEINPSGRLVDTYVYDNFSAPAMQNFGDFRYVDGTGNVLPFSYVNYAEGIYVGYKYYETRYEDAAMGMENVGEYDYASTVKYPFGYGLGYTDFTWSGFALSDADGEGNMTASITVTNSGSVAGKDVVQLYARKPYDADRGIETAAVELIGFVKTGELAPGSSEIVEITFNRKDLASYDHQMDKTYVLQSGEYMITAAANAHQAVNNTLSVRGYEPDGMFGEADPSLVGIFQVSADERFENGRGTEPITNRFDDAAVEGFTYLTRSNWIMMDNNGLRYATGSADGISETTDANGSVGTIAASADLEAKLSNHSAEASGNPMSGYPTADSYTYSAENRMELADFRGAEYDDERWDTLLDELKLSEEHQMFGKGGYMTMAIESINKPKTYEYDGPAGISNMITGAGAYSFPAEVMLASSWNQGLAAEFGQFIGEDALKTKTSGWYAPAMNIHRTPFSGRNYEYYSEDSFLSGTMAAAEVSAVQEKGVYVYAKHFALNDQETNRSANGMVATWANEQAIREIYLRPFQMAVEQGDAHGVMTAENRIGFRPADGCYALLTGVLRGEWGFQGVVVTDYISAVEGGAADMMLAAGTDLLLCTAQSKLTDAKVDWARAELRRSARNILFVQANSLAMNGFEHGTTYTAGFPVYKILLIAADALVVLGLAWGLFKLVKKIKMTPEEFAARPRWARKKKIIVWSVVGVAVVIAIIVFCVTLLPIIQDALLM